MPPRLHSRFTYSLGLEDTLGAPGVLQLTEREPFPFKAYPDNVEHTVAEGDTLWSLAALYFDPLPRAAGLWWVIADFQPDPIQDPTIALPLGSRVIIPSVRTVLEDIFNEKRRIEPVA